MRKNILMIAMVTMMAFCATACGGNNESTETTKEETTVEITTAEETTIEETTEEPTTEKVTKKTVKKKKNSTQNTETKKVLSSKEAKATAQNYVGKTLDELVSVIGQYNSMEKSKSCLVDGEYDGMFYYDGFTVSASTENGVWVISSID